MIDAYTGLPIQGVPVQMIGYPYVKVSDSDGWARFYGTSITIGSIVRVWATPANHAPGADEITILTNDNWVTLRVPPTSTKLSTGLIDHTQGGTFAMSGTLPTNPGTPVYMEVDVPANAFNQDVEIHLLPYPEHGFFTHGKPAGFYMVGAAHISVTDVAGNPYSQTLNAPVAVRCTPYAIQGINFADLFNENTIEFMFYDYVLHEWVSSSTLATYDSNTNLIEYVTSHFSIGGCSAEPDDDSGPGGNPPPDPPEVSLKWKKCELCATSNVACGTNTNGASCSVSATDSVTISGSLSASLNEKYGASAGNAALGEISAEIGISITGTVGGSLTATGGSTSTTSATQGGTAAGSACQSGKDEIYKIFEVYGVKVGGIEIGVIEVPLMTSMHSTRYNDPACCKPPYPIPPGDLPQKPDDCQ